MKGKPKYTSRPATCSPSRPTTSSAPSAPRPPPSSAPSSSTSSTLARAQDEEEQFWVLRMMAEELRHGYQMLHLLLEDDWTLGLQGVSRADMVEDILSMNTGSHVLGAFNIDFDSFVDNVVFCALIDRVGKYQLADAEDLRLPADGREHAADAARGGLPPRRRRGAHAPLGDGRGARRGAASPMDMLQKRLNKWLPRGLEMFGDERGGGTNVKLRPQADEERRGAGPVLRGGREAGARPQPALSCGRAARALTTAQAEAVLDRSWPARWSRASQPRGPAAHAARRSSSAAAASRRSAWWASTARPSTTLQDYLRHLVAQPARAVPRRAATSRTTSSAAQGGRGRDDAPRRPPAAMPSPAPRRRRLPVLASRCAGWWTTRPTARSPAPQPAAQPAGLSARSVERRCEATRREGRR